MTTGERMKLRRKQLGLSAEYVADRLGVSPATVYRYEKGDIEKMPGNILEPISKILATSPSYLMGWDDSPAPAPLSREIDPIYDALTPAGQKELCRYGRYLGTMGEYIAEDSKPQIATIKHYLIPAAAGYAAPIEGEDYEEIPLPVGAPTNADFCITIDGDSMEPYIHDGDMVFVKRDAPMKEFEPGIFFVDGDVLCKQWCIDYTGTLHLLSANPAREDANRSIPKSSGSTVVCFGKVLINKRLPQPIYD